MFTARYSGLQHNIIQLVSGFRPVTAQAISRRLPTRRLGFDPTTMSGGNDTGPGFSPSTSVFSCRYHPINAHIHLRLHTAITIRTNGRSLGTFHKAMLFRKSNSMRQKSTFHFFFFWLQTAEVTAERTRNNGTEHFQQLTATECRQHIADRTVGGVLTASWRCTDVS